MSPVAVKLLYHALTPAGSPKWQRIGQTGADLGEAEIVRSPLPDAEIERKIVADLPDSTDQSGRRFPESHLAIIDDLPNRTDFPVIRPLDDGAEKYLAVILPVECKFRREMDGHRTEAVGDDARPTSTEPGLVIDSRQQDAELCRDTWAGFVLKNAISKDALQKGAVADEAAARRRGGKRRLPLPLQFGLPTFSHTETKRSLGRCERVLRIRAQQTRGPQLNLKLADIGDRGICPVERPEGAGRFTSDGKQCGHRQGKCPGLAVGQAATDCAWPRRQTFVRTDAGDISRTITSRAISAGAWSGNGATELTLISHNTYVSSPEAVRGP
jgi:hypothetical protein